ncbi:MAG: CDP-diacylglycerol--serine O-phosphatidyltransferase [Saprospiraceae bacterium]|nr:MAG: CDP-diacylglycerol--serine O-phosphatidyltransferase [Saprospiraceae bacterium]
MFTFAERLPMKQQIPNAITLLNLFCGCCALVNVFYGHFISVFWFLFVAGLADYLDGAVARWLGVHSSLGKELDSLADLVSFGVVPGAILYMLLTENPVPEVVPQLNWMAAPAFLVSIFSGLRLAKFNLDTRQSENFIGLSTPPACLFVTGLMLIYYYNSFGIGQQIATPWVLYPVILVLSYLLVAEIPMFSFKFKQLTWSGNEIRITFALLSIVLLIVLREAAFSLIILLYILVNLFLLGKNSKIQS